VISNHNRKCIRLAQTGVTVPRIQNLIKPKTDRELCCE
jgi:hypothetical protein